MACIAIAAALYLRSYRIKRSALERARRRRLDYQPSARPVPAVGPLPVASPRRYRPVTTREKDPLEEPRSIQQSLLALAGKYSLDSLTLATSDGLVLASSGGNTAQEDAACYSRQGSGGAGGAPDRVVLFGLHHQHSELTGIIRAQGYISAETQKHIARDTEDILNRWI